MSVATGTVSFVQFTAIFAGNGTLVNVTVVTLAVPPVANTFTFCGNQISQFTNVSLSADGQTLTVTADPGTDPIVHYSLRFTDGGTTTLTWDPIIINH